MTAIQSIQYNRLGHLQTLERLWPAAEVHCHPLGGGGGGAGAEPSSQSAVYFHMLILKGSPEVP